MELYGIHPNGTNMFFFGDLYNQQTEGRIISSAKIWSLAENNARMWVCLIAIQMGKLLINHWMELGFQLLRHWKIV